VGQPVNLSRIGQTLTALQGVVHGVEGVE
jgi:hypothetical protein